MTRYIDADRLEDDCNLYDKWDAQIVKEWLKDQPTVDVAPVRHGEWITKSTGGEYFDCCSECGYVEWSNPNKYCPNCGAKMDVERKEE